MMPRPEEVDNLALKFVCVLIFINQNELKAALIMLADLLLSLQKSKPKYKQIIEIHRVRSPFSGTVTLPHLLDLRGEDGEIPILLFQCFGNAFLRVQSKGENFAQNIGLGEARRLNINFGFGDAGGNEVH